LLHSNAQKADEASTLPKPTPKPTPASKAKSFAGKLFSKKSTASAATVMSPKTAIENNDDSVLSPSITQRTPKHKTPKPAAEEMHPQFHKRVATPMDEAPWLGFFNMQPKTEPARPSDIELPKYMPVSPSPKNIPATPAELTPATKPTFNFAFSRELQLSPEAKKMMEETKAEAARIRSMMVAQQEDTDMTDAGDRKIAVPKGKAGRFSDIHMAEFKKMDSIANHPSLWRGNTTQANPTNVPSKSLKRSPSKAELDISAIPRGLKRSPSKADLNQSAIPSLKRSPSKADVTTLRSPTKISTPRSPFATIAVPASPEPSAKRAKITLQDNVFTRSTQSTIPYLQPTPRPKSSASPASGRSNIFSPTKASLARAQSVKSVKSNSKIPSLTCSNSTTNLFASPSPFKGDLTIIRSGAPSPSPIKASNAIASRTPTPPPMRPGDLQARFLAARTNRPTAIPSPTKTIKSILRTPHPLYSNDPSKIAAGTHLATPPSHLDSGIQVPATAPVIKHVEFTSSAREKADRDEAKAASAEPEQPLYPDLTGQVPRSREEIETNLCEQPQQRKDHRQTYTAPPKRWRDMPNKGFTFRGGMQKDFPPTSSTIRQVRDSDVNEYQKKIDQVILASFGADAKPAPKRKVDDMLEGEIIDESIQEKENLLRDLLQPKKDDDDDERPTKRARTGPPESEAKKPIVTAKKTSILKKLGASKKSIVLNNTRQSRSGGLSASRLAFLSQPKKRN
jgi:hypothetical protein